jgi:hypothetical protein
VTRRRLPVVLGLLAVLVGMAPGNGGGQSSGCTPGVSVQVPAASTPGVPVPVDTNANVVCPTPEASSPGATWGPTQSQALQPHPAGTGCTEEVWEPMELSLTPGGQQEVFWPNPSDPGTGSNTPEPQFISQIIGGISAMAFWTQAGTTTDFFMPFTLDGVWDKSGFNCVPRDPKNPQASFSEICRTAPVPVTCLRSVTHRTGGGALPITVLQGGLVDLRARMLQLIHPGTISSWPAQPNPALVNAPACFFVNGADVAGRNVNQPASFELVLLGPPDGDGRQIFYVFRVDLALQSVDWTFGDGSGATAALPAGCVGVSSAPLQFAHQFVSYSPPGGFAVTATETFTLHVTEFWVDGNGVPNPPADLGDLPPIVVNPGPVPPFREVVVQEEGVPIG